MASKIIGHYDELLHNKHLRSLASLNVGNSDQMSGFEMSRDQMSGYEMSGFQNCDRVKGKMKRSQKVRNFFGQKSSPKFLLFAFLVFFAQLSPARCQIYEQDHHLIDGDDIFDDANDKSTTTFRENAAGHSFSSSPYPHQVSTC